MLPVSRVSDPLGTAARRLLLTSTLLLLFATDPRLAANQETQFPPPLSIEEIELDLRLEPATHTLSAKVMLGLRSRSLRPMEVVRLVLPAPFADRAHIYAVWDRTGFLAWHTERREKDLLIVTTFTAPIGPLGQRALVVHFELDLAGFDAPEAPAQLTSRAASLHATGWYPLPVALRLTRINRLRLGLRLPRTWQLRSHTQLKHLHTSSEFAEYELTAKGISAASLVFSAYAQ